MRIARGNWQEAAAYVGAVISLAGGTYLAWKYRADWLGRAGSLVIVCGVLLASSRKFEALQTRVDRFLADALSREHETVRAGLTKAERSAPTDEEVSKVAKQLIAEAKREIDELIGQRKRVFKWHEVGLVTAGTIINGFGPWILQCLFGIQ